MKSFVSWRPRTTWLFSNPMWYRNYVYSCCRCESLWSGLMTLWLSILVFLVSSWIHIIHSISAPKHYLLCLVILTRIIVHWASGWHHWIAWLLQTLPCLIVCLRIYYRHHCWWMRRCCPLIGLKIMLLHLRRKQAPTCCIYRVLITWRLRLMILIWHNVSIVHYWCSRWEICVGIAIMIRIPIIIHTGLNGMSRNHPCICRTSIVACMVILIAVCLIIIIWILHVHWGHLSSLANLRRADPSEYRLVINLRWHRNLSLRTRQALNLLWIILWVISWRRYLIEIPSLVAKLLSWLTIW